MFALKVMHSFRERVDFLSKNVLLKKLVRSTQHFKKILIWSFNIIISIWPFTSHFQSMGGDQKSGGMYASGNSSLTLRKH